MPKFLLISRRRSVVDSPQKEKCFPNPTTNKPHELHGYVWYPQRDKITNKTNPKQNSPSCRRDKQLLLLKRRRKNPLVNCLILNALVNLHSNIVHHSNVYTKSSSKIDNTNYHKTQYLVMKWKTKGLSMEKPLRRQKQSP